MPILASLGGCGGGSEMVNSAPPPPSYTALANATSSTPLATQAARQEYVRLNNAGIPTITAQLASIEISYDSSSGVYRVRGAPMNGSTKTIDQSFGPGDASADIPRTYSRLATSGGTTESAGLTAGPISGFTYASYGKWTTGQSDSVNQNFHTLYFSYGVGTLPQDLPKTGQASYSLELSGDGGTLVGGKGTITADFAAGTIGASLAPTYNYGPVRISNFANLSGTGTIDSTHSSFAASVTGDGYSGSLSGSFYGPQAAEVGGAFTLTAPNGGVAAVGAFLGKKN
ncbi:transferrin-binding protein-like solute binding protein [Sphingomonas sp. YR710]|uniref:transferrin-binding protein-like solute binding protein n=1 Tax=Sphingomonas sp. YR710 TaxID=1882773 RepID=UPI00115FE2F0|nr:transferrin-binding protein-like solute binding protein [Sphingomonas sp. YR710]